MLQEPPGRDGPVHSRPVQSRDELLKALLAAADEVLGEVPAGLTEASSLTDDLGADSLDLLEIVMALEDELDLTADEQDFVGVRTVGEAMDVLARLAG